MSIDRYTIDVGGIDVEVVRKEIKHLHLGVYPPGGRVRVAAPELIARNGAQRRGVTQFRLPDGAHVERHVPALPLKTPSRWNP